jgi:hypothetical protein
MIVIGNEGLGQVIEGTEERGIIASKKQGTKEDDKTLRKEQTRNRAEFWVLYRSQNKG